MSISRDNLLSFQSNLKYLLGFVKFVHYNKETKKYDEPIVKLGILIDANIVLIAYNNVDESFIQSEDTTATFYPADKSTRDISTEGVKRVNCPLFIRIDKQNSYMNNNIHDESDIRKTNWVIMGLTNNLTTFFNQNISAFSSMDFIEKFSGQPKISGNYETYTMISIEKEGEDEYTEENIYKSCKNTFNFEGYIIKVFDMMDYHHELFPKESIKNYNSEYYLNRDNEEYDNDIREMISYFYIKGNLTNSKEDSENKLQEKSNIRKDNMNNKEGFILNSTNTVVAYFRLNQLLKFKTVESKYKEEDFNIMKKRGNQIIEDFKKESLLVDYVVPAIPFKESEVNSFEYTKLYYSLKIKKIFNTHQCQEHFFSKFVDHTFNDINEFKKENFCLLVMLKASNLIQNFFHKLQKSDFILDEDIFTKKLLLLGKNIYSSMGTLCLQGISCFTEYLYSIFSYFNDNNMFTHIDLSQIVINENESFPMYIVALKLSQLIYFSNNLISLNLSHLRLSISDLNTILNGVNYERGLRDICLSGINIFFNMPMNVSNETYKANHCLMNNIARLFTLPNLTDLDLSYINPLCNDPSYFLYYIFEIKDQILPINKVNLSGLKLDTNYNDQDSQIPVMNLLCNLLLKLSTPLAGHKLSNTPLSTLILKNCKIGDNEFEILTSFYKDNEYILSHLDLSNNNITYQSSSNMSILFEEFSKRMKEDSSTHYNYIFNNNPSLNSEDDRNQGMVFMNMKFNKPTTVEFSNTGMSLNALSSLANVLIGNTPSIDILNLSFNKIQSNDILNSKLCEGLNSIKNKDILRCIFLQGNSIQDAICSICDNIPSKCIIVCDSVNIENKEYYKYLHFYKSSNSYIRRNVIKKIKQKKKVEHIKRMNMIIEMNNLQKKEDNRNNLKSRISGALYNFKV